MTTCHSFKGYDAEVVLIPRADAYTTQDGRILAANLYVAMTRARSLLGIYSQNRSDSASQRLNEAIESCIAILNSVPVVDCEDSRRDDFHDLQERIGPEHRKWLLSLWNEFQIVQEPMLDARGNLLAEPLFWFIRQGKRYACFSSGELPPGIDNVLAEHGISRFGIGQTFPREWQYNFWDG